VSLDTPLLQRRFNGAIDAREHRARLALAVACNGSTMTWVDDPGAPDICPQRDVRQRPRRDRCRSQDLGESAPRDGRRQAFDGRGTALM
jgi:hypothetical protein